METVAFILLAIGGASFAASIFYELVNHKRKGGPVFEGRKKVVFPWAIASWLVFAAGFVIVASSRW